VHRGRFGGNARKRKAKLTDDTFHTMISPAARAEAHVATIEPDAGGETVVVLAEELAVVHGPSLAQPVRAYARTDGRRFACQDYQFGYTACRNCHSDQAFYVHQADLEQGYTFRCRICRHELTVSAQA
jgi:hypothetical protein